MYIKKIFSHIFFTGIALVLLGLTNQTATAQVFKSESKKQTAKWQTLPQQLDQEYYGKKVVPGSELEKLIRNNQELSMLRADEIGDSRLLPPWLRVFWRKNHPEVDYNAEDPTGGYPLVLKEVLEWMMTHQDLKPGPGSEKDEEEKERDGLTTVNTNVRTSGLQAAARSESDIRINYFNSQKILAASNNISASGQQGVYYSTDGGTSWGQSLLPLQVADSFHSDPTAEWTNDGRAYSSTIGINAAGSVLMMRNYYSTDNGATWLFDATFSGTQTNTDKQLVWVDHSSTSPYFGRQYAIWHNGNPAYMNRRTPGSAGTWMTTPVTVSTGDGASGTRIGADVKTNSAGDVFGFYPATTNRGMYVVKSTTGGDTFAAAVKITTTLDSYDIGVPSFSGRRALIYISGGAYRTASKNLVYASWTDLSGDAGCTAAASEPGTNAASTCKTRIWFSRSTDGGATWSAPLKVNNQAGLNDQFNQALAVDETTGTIGIIYYDTVGDAARKKTDIWFQNSADDGVTFSTPEKVTSAMTDETIAGADSGNQYGDYNSLSGFASNFFPSWTDRRSNAKEEIWTAKISTLGPTAAAASLGGRVLNKNRGINNAEVTLLDPNTGETRYTKTNPSGYYHFSDVTVGKSYLISVKHKQYQFVSQIMSLTQDLDDFNFTAVK